MGYGKALHFYNWSYQLRWPVWIYLAGVAIAPVLVVYGVRFVLGQGLLFLFIDIIDGDGIYASVMPNRDVFIVLEENVE